MDTTTKLLLFLIFIGACVFFYRAYILPLIAQNEMKQKYQSAHEPYLVLQSCELDKDFWGKYEREVARFTDVGNKWALEQIPAIPFPFNSNFSFQWFEKTMNVSTIGLGQMEYLDAAKRQYVECLTMWQQKTFKEFGHSATFKANGQNQPKGDIWESQN